ncbi:uncharacterized protein EV154DRAFT_501933 [Mucor mucedo]|uniref:uncharacterized protein n=1 Tax=Mucor mucedo TaxID=29922 RepID=UPI00221FD4C9|nr:uncharacterized protein EV154DRAFT_501933 [Mucor mucedo]KAI7893406.1 hypothetical protein EV154DRAFT_501933 [Mucor mucedo]
MCNCKNRIHEFMKSYRHREIKGYIFSNRRMANDHAASVVLGYTNVNEPYKLSVDSSSHSRRKKRRIFNGTNEQHLRDQNNPYDQHRTVVAYGDASLSGTFKKHTPIPVKKIQRAIAQRALVIPVDEYNTSQKCCHCLQQTRNINYSKILYMQQPRLKCKHRKINYKYRDERRKHLKCVDDEDNILWNTTDCYEREESKKSCAYCMVTDTENLFIFIIGAFQNVYPLKLCQNCQREGSPCVGLFVQIFIRNSIRLIRFPQIWNRDINASCNIRTVLTRYIRLDFDLDSRQPQLTRTRQDDQ